MKGIDIVVVLKSGLREEDYYVRKYNSFSGKGIKTRLLFYIPIKYPNDLRESDDCWDYWNFSFFSSKKRHCWQSVERRAFLIYPSQVSFEEYVLNPQVRLSDDANPENLVLIVDDYLDSGETLMKVNDDLVNLRYNKENIFSYIGHDDKIHKDNVLYDSEWNQISYSEFSNKIDELINQNN